jgi:nucleotide-binding universal stress UspA family protein
MTRVRSILVPTDFSQPSKAAWRYALTLAAAFKSRLHLLHVIAPSYRYDPWGTETATLNLAAILARSEKNARRDLARLVPRKGPLARRVVTATTHGIVVNEILGYIDRKRIDLVVMGTHGHGRVERFLLGSVAERLVRRSPVPVLTMHGATRARQLKTTARRRPA